MTTPKKRLARKYSIESLEGRMLLAADPFFNVVDELRPQLPNQGYLKFLDEDANRVPGGHELVGYTTVVHPSAE